MMDSATSVYIFDKVLPPAFGASVGAFIAIAGWFVNIYFSYRLGVRNFKNQFLEKAFWKIEDKLTAYQAWLAKLNGMLQGFDKRSIDKYGIPRMDYGEKAKELRAHVLKDPRSDDWFQAIANYEQTLPTYNKVTLGLHKRHNMIEEFVLDLVRQINGRSEGQYIFDVTAISFDRINDQGRLISELNGNLQFDCFKDIVKQKMKKTNVDEPRPFIAREKDGRILLEE